MTSIDDYQKSGGLYGAAVRKLQEELLKAEQDDTHPLAAAVRAKEAGLQKKFDKLLTKAMIAARADDNSPLSLPLLMFLEIPVAVAAFDKAAELIDARDYPETFTDMAQLGYLYLAGEFAGKFMSRSAGGSRRAQNLAKVKAKILAAWDAYGSKDKGYQAFASHYFRGCSRLVD